MIFKRTAKLATTIIHSGFTLLLANEKRSRFELANWRSLFVCDFEFKKCHFFSIKSSVYSLKCLVTSWLGILNTAALYLSACVLLYNYRILHMSGHLKKCVKFCASGTMCQLLFNNTVLLVVLSLFYHDRCIRYWKM